MGSPSPVGIWGSQLKDGDPQAAQQLWNTYFVRMVKVARCKLHGAPAGMADEEDVALSAFKSFCRGTRDGRFTEMQDHEDPWPLLLALTTHKAIDLLRYERRVERRGPCPKNTPTGRFDEPPAARLRMPPTDRQRAGSSSRGSGCRGMPGDPRSVQRHDPARHRAVEDGGVHHGRDRFQARLHHADRRAKAPAHSQALGLWSTLAMIADSEP